MGRVYSQETEKIILNEINKMTDDDVPVVLKVSNSINSELIKISYKEYSRSSHKMVNTHECQTLFTSAKNPLKLHVEYTKKEYSKNLWLRIYPASNDPAFVDCPISCCEKHRRYLSTRYKERYELALNSIMEILQYDVKYENVILDNMENQVSVACPYTYPSIFVPLEFKCYNSCLKCTKSNYPKLVFRIEEINEERNSVKILAQKEILLKVCASPGRDSKQKRLLQTQESESTLLPSSTLFQIGGESYYLKLIPQAHIPILEHLNKISKHSDNGRRQTLDVLEREIYTKYRETFEDITKIRKKEEI